MTLWRDICEDPNDAENGHFWILLTSGAYCGSKIVCPLAIPIPFLEGYVCDTASVAASKLRRFGEHQTEANLSSYYVTFRMMVAEIGT